MGSFNFKWDHPAEEVYVTGTFDDWSKSVRLDKKDGYFEKSVDLPTDSEKVYYKFVADGNWMTDHTAPQESDHHNNTNNVLHPHEIKPRHTAHTMSSASPTSTTAGLAGAVPKESEQESSHSHTMSSAAPMSTTAMLAGAVPKESEKTAQDDHVPGAFPETPAPDSSRKEMDFAQEDDNVPGAFPETPAAYPSGEEKNFSVNPLPATSGTGNPVPHSSDGKVPDSSDFTDNTTNSAVTTDKESYEKGEKSKEGRSIEEPSTYGVNPIPATSGIGNPVHTKPGEKVPESSDFTDNAITSAVTTDKESYEKGESTKEPSAFGVNPIPATSGMGNPVHTNPGESVPDPSSFTSNTINSNVKLDKDSYERSDAAPQLPELTSVFTPQEERDASGGMFNLPAVGGKMIPESSLPMGGSAPTEKDPGFTIQSAHPESSTAALAGQVPKEPRGAPDIVRESQKEAHVDPEASGSADMVQEKKELESELLKEVSKAPPISESQADTSEVGAYGAGRINPDILKSINAMNAGTGSSGVPAIVTDSQHKAHQDPEAAANPEAVAEKSTMEAELAKVVTPTDTTGTESSGVPNIVTASQHKAHQDPEAAANPEAVADKAAVESELARVITPTHATGAESSGVPYIVTASQHKAHQDPEAAANPEAVAEKAAVESELSRVVTPTHATGAEVPGVPNIVTASQHKAHHDPEAAANPEAVAEKAAVESELSKVVTPTHATDAESSGVPDIVIASQHKAHRDPEAAANPEAVAEKSAVESELAKVITPTYTAGEPAPTVTASTSATAPGDKPISALSPTLLSDDEPFKSSEELVKPSSSPAEANTIMSIPPHEIPSTSNDAGLNAPADAPAITSTQRDLRVAEPNRSRDVSPMTREPTKADATETGPTVTSGVGSTTPAPEVSKAPTTSTKAPETTPQKENTTPAKSTGSGTPDSASAAADKKSKRRSFFGKLKDKFK